jgi:hypothetical protein
MREFGERKGPPFTVGPPFDSVGKCAIFSDSGSHSLHSATDHGGTKRSAGRTTDKAFGHIPS